MVRIIENAALVQYNTFGIDVKADSFFEFTEKAELLEYLSVNTLNDNYLIIGGGSNLLFTRHFNGLVLYPNIPGITVVDEDAGSVYLEAGAGENWDDVVEYAVKFGWGGIENLSGIPGKAGASAVQNIGAYGVEVKDVIFKVNGIDLDEGKTVEFSNADCRFGYRDSIFKNELRNRVVVTSVVLKLEKFYTYNLGYGTLKSDVEKTGEVNLQNVRDVVLSIRGSKLPDFKLTGNAGSFFKNPFVDARKAKTLQMEFSSIPLFEVPGEKRVKLAAGWLIEQCGWKGYREGDAGVHPKQALVLVNYGNASGKDILHLSEKIQKSVYDKFGVELSLEVNVI
ncbi:MAG: UDP-N-acetylmuramate dehydrogenase [Prolixibacteraceae bacterium]|nr:UDP-N-acetylmuramate dehydrogenase [Prolixibacteraceae bacterium]